MAWSFSTAGGVIGEMMFNTSERNVKRSRMEGGDSCYGREAAEIVPRPRADDMPYYRGRSH